MSGRGAFAGKVALGSPTSPAYYLRAEKAKGSSGPSLPVMGAAAIGPGERCILYSAGAAGQYYMQLPGGLWMSLKESLGWLVLTDDLAQALPVALAGTGDTRQMQVVTAAGNLTVTYQMAPSTQALLTVNPAEGALDSFVVTTLTPSLEELRNGGGVEADLTSVDLSGADLRGIDFGKADFTGADLTGAGLAKATLTGASLARTTLKGLTADGAVLDQVDFTGAELSGVSWGKPASAKGIVLTDCKAAGAVLGSADATLDCTGATLTNAMLSGAVLTRLDLTGAKLGGAVLVKANLDKAILDGADIGKALMLGCSLVGASLRRVKGHGALLMGADLSQANLNQAQLGARAFLFDLAASYAADLDEYAYPQPALIKAFSDQGVSLATTAPVAVVEASRRWRIDDRANGPFALVLAASGRIEVYSESESLTPASLAGTRCVGTQASSAILTGVDLRRVQWSGSGATLDHADLSGACLSGSLMADATLTQATLSGADFTDAILVGVDLSGCTIGGGGFHQPTAFGGAQLQGARFPQATLLSATLYRGGVATADGVPLLQLPLADEAKLTTAGLIDLSPAFLQAGYPLGPSATVTDQSEWRIDNSSDPNSSSPREYAVRRGSAQLEVFDGASGDYLFPIAATFAKTLDGGAATANLRAVFSQNQYSLAEGAPVTGWHGWRINAGTDQPVPGPVNYPTMQVLKTPAVLQVYGITLMRLRDWSAYSQGLAFGGTAGLQQALGGAVTGPSGYPYDAVIKGTIDWIRFLSA